MPHTHATCNQHVGGNIYYINRFAAAKYRNCNQTRTGHKGDGCQKNLEQGQLIMRGCAWWRESRLAPKLQQQCHSHPPVPPSDLLAETGIASTHLSSFAFVLCAGCHVQFRKELQRKPVFHHVWAGAAAQRSALRHSTAALRALHAVAHVVYSLAPTRR
jgi:hypothetical protein